MFDSPFFKYHPSGPRRCYLKNGRQVDSLNVPPTTKSNLCRMAPELPGQCEWQQGMLMLGMQGSEHADLYVDANFKYREDAAASSMAMQGAGLFVRGGNPIYYTMKGSANDISQKLHSILRNSLDDIAGDHIVFRLAKDENTLQPYMYVHRTPLASNLQVDNATMSNSYDPIETLYILSKLSQRQTGGNRGWLYNLESEMRAEQAQVDKLYAAATESSSSSNNNNQQEGQWACPLLRFAFWSKVVQDFSPLVPSPVRAARLFGTEERGSLLPRGMRSHPTQLFSSLYDRLANVLTSNGFCYCVDPTDCQVPHATASNNNNCTLLETIRSLYDQRYRSITLLQKKNATCMQQLDWPFEAGMMRDSSIHAGRNDPNEACNVLNRLPPFQYAYKPVGTINKKPAADGKKKTSLDEGGSCHMGRAAGWHPRMTSATVTAVSECRKIYSNYTHVVARCKMVSAGSNVFQDYEMRREMSAAPTWMVEAMRTQRRQKCDTCSAPPVWRTEFSNEPLPHGPEVSYGIPFRWSAARLLASDMRAAACGRRRNDTKECDSLLNLANWNPQQFMQRYMGSAMPELLALNTPPADDALAAAAGIGDLLRNATTMNNYEDEFLWSGTGWVACSQYNTTCYGTMKKSDWYNRERRGATCNRVFAEEVRKGNVNSTAVGLDVCNLNSKTNLLCQQLKAAQALFCFFFANYCLFFTL